MQQSSSENEKCELQGLRAGENLLLNALNDSRMAKSGKEIVQSWLMSAAERRLHVGRRELTAEENELISQVLQCILADFITNDSNRRDTMQPHQQRVVDEKSELDSKLGKLLTFIDAGKGATFSTLVTEERERLTTQARIMREYSDILADRINAF